MIISDCVEITTFEKLDPGSLFFLELNDEQHLGLKVKDVDSHEGFVCFTTTLARETMVPGLYTVGQISIVTLSACLKQPSFPL